MRKAIVRRLWDIRSQTSNLSKVRINEHLSSYGELTRPTLTGYIERLSDAGIQPESYDIAISNCVVNLSPDKPAVLREVYRRVIVARRAQRYA